MKVENKKHLRAKSFHHILQPRLIVKFELKLNDKQYVNQMGQHASLIFEPMKWPQRKNSF